MTQEAAYDKQTRIRANRRRRLARRPFAFPKGTTLQFRGYFEYGPRIMDPRAMIKHCT